MTKLFWAWFLATCALFALMLAKARLEIDPPVIEPTPTVAVEYGPWIDACGVIHYGPMPAAALESWYCEPGPTPTPYGYP